MSALILSKGLQGKFVWKLACWLIVAFAVYAFQVATVDVALIFGAFAALFFTVDFKVSMMKIPAAATSADPTVKFRKRFHLAMLAVWLIIAAQLVMRWMKSDVASHEAVRSCFICS